MGLALDEIWGPSLVLFAVAILLFPDGRLASAWWRGALRVYFVLFGLLLAATAGAFAVTLTEHPLHVDGDPLAAPPLPGVPLRPRSR